MELQACLLFTTLVVCGADIRRAGWLDKVVAHWKKSFVEDFQQLAPFNLDATIEPAPPGYQDSPSWDFNSVSRMLALLSVSETGQPALNSLRRMLAPTRRMMMDVPGLAGSYIPQSLYKKRRGNNRLGINDRSVVGNYRQRVGNNRMESANKRKGMANNRKGMANNRMGRANNRMGRANNRMGRPNYQMGKTNYPIGVQSKTRNGKFSRKQMWHKKLKEKQLTDFQMSFKLFPSIKHEIGNDIYYDEQHDSYGDESPEYEFVNPLEPPSEDIAVVVLRNPVEARLPSARISVKLLKEILEARAIAARVMPPKKTTSLFTWSPNEMTTSLTNETSDDNSTAAESTATGGTDDGATTDGSGGATGVDGASPPGGGDGNAATTEATSGEDTPTPDTPPPGQRRKAAKIPLRKSAKPQRKKA